jgi:hypothetical protein
MFKYIIASCFKKMVRRAFHWASYFMIGVLSSIVVEDIPNVETTAIEPDYSLSQFLAGAINDSTDPNIRTFGDWVMTYHPSKDCSKLPSESNPLAQFLKVASGSSKYEFNQPIASAFHDLLLSILYAYLCLMAQINKSLSPRDEQQIKRYVGPFSNAIRILYLISHSNAMKAYFALVRIPTYYPTEESVYYTNSVNRAINTKLDGSYIVEPDNEESANYMEDFKNENGGELRSIYRRSLMSFVDHFAGLFLLQRRSFKLPASETIKLSLIAVRPPGNFYYLGWEVMEDTIRETCEVFKSSGESNPIEGEDMIIKIKEFLQKIVEKIGDSADISDVIFAFKTLLEIFDKGKRLAVSQYPRFNACIHCESSLAAILWQIHGDSDLIQDSDLSTLFKASPPFLTHLI